MNKETILTVIQFLMACENQNPEDIRLAAAHFEACMKWETEIKALTGRDSIEDVKQYILDLNHKLTNRTQELNDIRALIGASPEESTYDEVHRILNTKLP